jgi:hypothetical protein
MQNIRMDILVLAAAIVIAGWLVGHGMKGARYVLHGDGWRFMRDTHTGALYRMNVLTDRSGKWEAYAPAP